MSTLTPMDRTATGWKCPRCGDAREDDILSVRTVECNCARIDAFRYGLFVTLTAEQLRERFPLNASGSMNASGDAVASGSLRAWVDPSEHWENEDLDEDEP